VEIPINVPMIKDIEPMLDNNLFLFGTVTESMKLTIRIVLILCFRIRRTAGYKSISKKTSCSNLNLYSTKGTTVTRIDLIDDNVHGFVLEPFNRLLDESRVYHEHEAVDVIGFVVAIGDLVPVQSSVGQKIRRTVVIEDAESNQLDCTFWDHWATMWDEYVLKHNKLGHTVFILQLGKVKYWNGALAIHNALFGTKMFINRDVPEILAFRQCVRELPEYDES
ncbi:replication protein A 70 kDa DNA-binding subunit B, partial [Tanacetum coccineum]